MDKYLEFLAGDIFLAILVHSQDLSLIQPMFGPQRNMETAP